MSRERTQMLLTSHSELPLRVTLAHLKHLEIQLDKALQYFQSESSSAEQSPVSAIPGDKQRLKEQINRGRRSQCGNASISLVPNLSLFKSLCTTFYSPSVPCHCIASCKSDHGDKSIRE